MQNVRAMTPPQPQRTDARIGCVVLHYQNPSVLDDTISGVLAQLSPFTPCVVIDNHSEPDPTDELAVNFPSVHVVRNGRNLGYAGGMNVGIRELVRMSPDIDYILLLTHEVRLEAKCVERLVAAAAAQPQFGALGPVLMYRSDPELVYSSGGEVVGSRLVQRHRNSRASRRDLAVIDPRCDWLDGSCVLYQREALERVEGLDEGYFLWFEEVDLHLRLSDAGYLIGVCPSAIACQEPSASRDVLLFTRNRLRFLARRRAFGALAREVWHLSKTLAIDVRSRRFRLAARRLGGVVWFASWVPVRWLRSG